MPDKNQIEAMRKKLKRAFDDADQKRAKAQAALVLLSHTDPELSAFTSDTQGALASRRGEERAKRGAFVDESGAQAHVPANASDEQLDEAMEKVEAHLWRRVEAAAKEVLSG